MITSLSPRFLINPHRHDTGRGWAPPTHRIEDDPFAHVLIDEAQDLSPMQWRMVGRRGRAASWTIVGDPAQSSWPVPEEAAAARAEALEGKQLHEFHLSTNYRNSSEIYEHAAAYAQRVGLDADLPTAVRSTGEHPTVLRERVTSPGGTTAAAVRELEDHKVRAAFMTALESARDRSRALARGDDG